MLEAHFERQLPVVPLATQSPLHLVQVNQPLVDLVHSFSSDFQTDSLATSLDASSRMNATESSVAGMFIGDARPKARRRPAPSG